MKKILSAVLVCALLVVSVFTLASCGGGLNGTYEIGDTYTEEIMPGYEVSFTAKYQLIFSGSNITMKTVVETNIDELDFGMFQETVEDIVNPMVEELNTEITGTFEIEEDEDGDKTITFTYTDEDGETVPVTSTFEQGSDDDGEYVSIDGIKYYKA